MSSSCPCTPRATRHAPRLVSGDSSGRSSSSSLTASSSSSLIADHTSANTTAAENLDESVTAFPLRAPYLSRRNSSKSSCGSLFGGGRPAATAATSDAPAPAPVFETTDSVREGEQDEGDEETVTDAPDEQEDLTLLAVQRRWRAQRRERQRLEAAAAAASHNDAFQGAGDLYAVLRSRRRPDGGVRRRREAQGEEGETKSARAQAVGEEEEAAPRESSGGVVASALASAPAASASALPDSSLPCACCLIPAAAVWVGVHVSARAAGVKCLRRDVARSLRPLPLPCHLLSCTNTTYPPSTALLLFLAIWCLFRQRPGWPTPPRPPPVRPEHAVVLVNCRVMDHRRRTAGAAVVQ